MPLNTSIAEEEYRPKLHEILTHGDNAGQAANTYFIRAEGDAVANHVQEYNELISPLTSIARIQQILRDIDPQTRLLEDYATAARSIFAENLAFHFFRVPQHGKLIDQALTNRFVSEADLQGLHDPKKTQTEIRAILTIIQGETEQELATTENTVLIVQKNIECLFHRILSLTGESERSSLRTALRTVLLENHQTITEKLSAVSKQDDFETVFAGYLDVLANSTDQDKINGVLTELGVAKQTQAKLLARENAHLQRLDKIYNPALKELLKQGIGEPLEPVQLSLAQIEEINQGLQALQPIPSLIASRCYYDPHPNNFLTDLGLLLHRVTNKTIHADPASQRAIRDKQTANANILYLFKCEREGRFYPAGTHEDTDCVTNISDRRVALKSKTMLRILMTKQLDHAVSPGNRMSISDVATLDKRFYDLAQEVDAGTKTLGAALQEFNGWISAYSPDESTIEFTEDEFERAVNYARYSGLTDPSHYHDRIELLKQQLSAGCTLRTETLLTTDLQLTKHGQELAKIEAKDSWQRLEKLLDPAFGGAAENRLKLDVLLQQLTQLDLINRLTLMDLESYRDDLDERLRQIPSSTAVKQLELDKKHEKEILAFRKALEERISLVNERIHFHERIDARLHGETEDDKGLLAKAREAKTPGRLNASGGQYIDIPATDNLREKLQNHQPNLSVDAADKLKPHKKAPVIDPKKVRLKSFTMGSGGYSIKPGYKHYEVIELAENEDAKAMQLLEMAAEIIVNLDSLPSADSKLRVSGGNLIDAAMLKEALVFCLRAAGVSNPDSVIIMRYTYSDKMRQEDYGKRWFRWSSRYKAAITKAAAAESNKTIDGVQEAATDKFAKGLPLWGKFSLFADKQQLATAEIGTIRSTLGEFNKESNANDRGLSPIISSQTG